MDREFVKSEMFEEIVNEFHNPEDTIDVALTGAETLLLTSVVKAVLEEGDLGPVTLIAQSLVQKIKTAIEARVKEEEEAGVVDDEADEETLSEEEVQSLFFDEQIEEESEED